MYMTLFAGSPCPKTVSFPRNFSTFLRRPAESRNNCTSNTRFLEFAFLRVRRTGMDERRAAEDTIRQNSMKLDSVHCTILNSTCRSAQRSQSYAEHQQVLMIQKMADDLNGPAGPSAATGALPIPRRS